MINVTDFFLNFSDFLVCSNSHLQAACISPGDDAWFQFIENSFDVFIINAIRERHNFEVDFEYALWSDASTDREQFIVVLDEPVCDALIGQISTRDSGERIINFRNEQLEKGYLFAFRELSHPFKRSTASMYRFIEGQGLIGTDTVRICVPFCNVSVFFNPEN